MKVHFNISFPSKHRSSKSSLSLRFPSKTMYAPLLFSLRATCPSHLHLLEFITRIILHGGSDHKAPRYVLFLLQSPVASVSLSPRSSVTPCSRYIRSLHSSLNVRDHVSHPYTSTGEIIVL